MKNKAHSPKGPDSGTKHGRPPSQAKPASGAASPSPAQDQTLLAFRPASGIVFRMLFTGLGKESDKLLKSLVASLMEVDEGILGDLAVNPSEPHHSGIYMEVRGCRIVVDIQTHYHRGFEDRMAFRYITLARPNPAPGNESGALPDMALYCIADFVLPDLPESDYRRDFTFMEQTTHEYLSANKKDGIVLLQLPKIPPFEKGSILLFQWLNFLKATTEEELAKIAKDGHPILQAAVHAYQEVLASPEFLVNKLDAKLKEQDEEIKRLEARLAEL